MKKKDLITALIIGEISAWLIVIISKSLIERLPFWWLLLIILPVLSGLGMLIALFLEKRSVVFYQFSKFFLVGGMNVLIDLGILSLLIVLFKTDKGLWYSVFKGLSFLLATVNSYFWNKLWTFETEKGKFDQFLTVSLIGLLINVGTASLIVNLISIPFGLTASAWAIIGALGGSLAGLTLNFLGYKFIVFK